MRTASPTDSAVTALAPMVWGSTYIVTTQFLPADRPLLAATVRALPAGLLLMAFTRTRPHGSWWIKAIVLGSLNIGLFFVLLFIAAYRLPGGVAALVGSVQPLFVLLLGALLLRTSVRRHQIVACLVGAAGVGLLVLRADAALTAVGVFAGLGGALSMAAGIVLTKRWGRPPGVSLLGFTGIQLALGGLLLLPVTLVFEGLPARITSANVGGFTYLALVGALIAYALWFRGIERLPALAVSFLGFFSPLTATLLGLLLLGQSLAPLQIVGAVMVLAAVVLAQRTPTALADGAVLAPEGTRPAS